MKLKESFLFFSVCPHCQRVTLMKLVKSLRHNFQFSKVCLRCGKKLCEKQHIFYYLNEMENSMFLINLVGEHRRKIYSKNHKEQKENLINGIFKKYNEA